jgi:chitinase
VGQQIGFNDLITLGAIAKSGSAYVARAGYTRYFDSCSSTPFLVNAVRNTVVTYDDPESIQLKAAYALKAGIGGVGFWSMPTDSSDYSLMNAARAGLGLQ